MCRHYSNRIFQDAVQHEAKPGNDTPEHNLLAAILERGIRDAQSRTIDSTLSTEAKNWIESNDIAPFSFRWVCDHLGLFQTATMIRFLVYQISIPVGRRFRQKKKITSGPET